jgi:HK97 family phage portal protein
MGALDKMLGVFGLSRRSTLMTPDSWMWEAFGASRTGSGVDVSPESAMRLSAVWAAVRLISETVSTLPLHVYERGDSVGTRADSNRVAQLLANPSPMLSGMAFREVLQGHVLLWGNAYAAILRNGAGEPVELVPVLPQFVRVSLTARRRLVYDVVLPGNNLPIRLDQADMIHVAGLSFDGIKGLSVVRYAAQAIGLGIAAEAYGATFFGNASQPAGYISVPEKLTKEQAQVLREQWQSIYGGTANAHKTAVIPGGGTFNKITIPNNEAQFLESRKFQITDIARWFRVPPHMIGDLERATFSNIEHQSLEFVQHCIRPWLVRWEQELNRKLFPPVPVALGQGDEIVTGPSPFYAEFNVDGLLRGDLKTRSDYYVKARQWGWLSVNDIRRKENLPPVDGGDVYLSPLNMQPLDSPRPTEGEGEGGEGSTQ